MPDPMADVLLITDDRQLRELVDQHRPLGAKLQCLSPQEFRADRAVRARQVWIDLDSGSGKSAPRGVRRVYFHSRQPPTDETVLPGLYIRKPCPSTVIEVLWAGVDVSSVRGSSGESCSTRRALPGWLLEFQELDLKVLCRKYVTRLGPRLGYREVSLYLHDARHGLLTLAGATHTRSIDLTVPLNAGDQYLMAAIARDGRVMRTDEIGPELAKRGIARRPDRPYQDGKCLVAPLVSEGRLWGVLNLSGCLRTPLTELGLPLDEILAFLGRALHHACAYEEARTEARVDGLTGLYNQRWMLEALAKEIRRAQRFATPLSVLMIDLDGLKSVNDREGHAAGDCLLRHVAARIAAVLRQFDGAARVGGDEFVAMLPGTSLQGAQQVARRLLHSVREDPPRFRATPLEITASIGAVEWRDGWDARQLLDAADQAMYRAKEQGRDTLVCEPIDRPPIVRVGSCVSSDAGASATTRFSGPEQSAPKAVPTTPAEVRPPRAMDSSACGVRPSGATSSEHE